MYRKLILSMSIMLAMVMFLTIVFLLDPNMVGVGVNLVIWMTNDRAVILVSLLTAFMLGMIVAKYGE